jgi:rhamnogalacturonan acetylesterase
MWTSLIPLALALVGQVTGQTVYLAGDSTTAAGGGGKGTEGKTTLMQSSIRIYGLHPTSRLTSDLQ